MLGESALFQRLVDCQSLRYWGQGDGIGGGYGRP
jgi:hypothetical protein